MKKKPKTWLDGLIGWKPEGNVTETYWIGDPAVDQEKSDWSAYGDNLGKEHLVLRPGETPSRIIITLPTAAQWGNISIHMSDAGHGTAPVVAFQLCVRFPDLDVDLDLVEGFRRLPEAVMHKLTVNHPDMVTTLGYWIINKYLLAIDEKKASSPESTATGSSPTNGSGSTTAPSAPTGERGSKGAPTSARKRGRRRTTATSG